ncbi:unnamed protein product, partial [Amoebophrya sp. A120]
EKAAAGKSTKKGKGREKKGQKVTEELQPVSAPSDAPAEAAVDTAKVEAPATANAPEEGVVVVQQRPKAKPKPPSSAPKRPPPPAETKPPAPPDSKQDEPPAIAEEKAVTGSVFAKSTVFAAKPKPPTVFGKSQVFGTKAKATPPVSKAGTPLEEPAPDGMVAFTVQEEELSCDIDPRTMKVKNILPAGVAASAGVQEGDTIVTINGKRIPDVSMSDWGRRPLRIVVKPRSSAGAQVVAASPVLKDKKFSQEKSTTFAVTVEEADMGCGIDPEAGFRVVSVAPDGAAASANVKVGDRVVAVNGQLPQQVDNNEWTLRPLELVFDRAPPTSPERRAERGGIGSLFSSASKRKGDSKPEEKKPEAEPPPPVGEVIERVDPAEVTRRDELLADLMDTGDQYAAEVPSNMRGNLGFRLDYSAFPFKVRGVNATGWAANSRVNRGDVLLEVQVQEPNPHYKKKAKKRLADRADRTGRRETELGAPPSRTTGVLRTLGTPLNFGFNAAGAVAAATAATARRVGVLGKAKVKTKAKRSLAPIDRGIDDPDLDEAAETQQAIAAQLEEEPTITKAVSTAELTENNLRDILNDQRPLTLVFAKSTNTADLDTSVTVNEEGVVR